MTTHAGTIKQHDIVERHAALFAAFSRACLTDPSLLARIPHESELALVPDDDLELAAYNIAQGKRGVDAGRNVFFHHVRIADFPELREEVSAQAH